MTCAIDDSIRQSLDAAYAVSGQLGLHPYALTLYKVVTVATSGPSYAARPGIGTKTVTSASVLIGPSRDQNPAFVEVSGRDVFLSNGRLTDADFKMGPIVRPYSGSCGSGGTDPSIFDPALTGSMQLYLKASRDGQDTFFKRVYDRDDSALTYYIYWRANGEVPTFA